MKYKVSVFVFVTLIWTLFLSGGASSMSGNGNVEYWVEDALIKVLPNQKPRLFAASEVTIDAARGEYESAQIIVRAKADVTELKVKTTTFTGNSTVLPKIKADFITTVPVRVGTKDVPEGAVIALPPADIPDPFSELSTMPLKAQTNQTIWLTVSITPRVEPGKYETTVKITADEQTISVPVTLNVYSAKVPSKRSLYVTNWFNTTNIAKAHNVEKYTEEFWKALGNWAKVMADHRQNTVITPIFELITAQKDAQGNMTFNFTNFDRWVKLFMKNGFTTIEGGHFGSRGDWNAPDFDAFHMITFLPDGSAEPNPNIKVSSEAQRVFLSKFLPVFQEHLRKNGWLEIYYQHLCDEPITLNAASYNKLASYIREYAPKFRIIEASMCKEIVGYIDTWVPQPQEVDSNPGFFKERVNAGDEVWFYTCLSPRGKYMNRFIDFPQLKTRLLHWMNYKYEFTGYLHWGLNYWQGDPWTLLEPGWGGGTYLPPGDSHLVYPGKNGPLSSIRFEAMRDGIEDFELLKQLAKRNRKKADTICDSIVHSMTDYELDPAKFRIARLELLKALSD